MFEKLKRRGLYARLERRVGTHRDDPAQVAILFEVARANYPLGMDRPGLQPCIPKEEIWKVTEAFVDHGVGTLDDLFRNIWDLDIKEYVEEYVEKRRASSDND